MSPSRTLAVAARVLTQLRRDPRTLALLVVVPCLLLALLRWMFDGRLPVFHAIGGPLVGLFPLIMLFLVASISMLRERTTGTLERLLSTSMAKLDLLVGYAIAFTVVAIVQAGIAAAVTFWLLGVPIAGSTVTVVVLAIVNSMLGMSFGLCTSALVRTEFQAVQFMPAVIFPQLLVCGLFIDHGALPGGLRQLSSVLPMTWSFDALQRAVVRGEGFGNGQLLGDVALTVGAVLVLLALGAVTLRRQTD